MKTSAASIPSTDENPRVGASLNPAQQAAVTHGEGPILVLAGAGSGKTRVLTHRIAHLVSTGRAKPDNILAVTFTNKAADEMKHRLKALLQDQAEGLWVSTFHSACLKILRRHAKLLGYRNDFVVYDDQDSTSLMKKLLKEQQVTDKKLTPSYVLGCIDRWKNEYIDPGKAATIKGSYLLSVAAELYDKYQRALLQSQAMDFGDLLFKGLQLFSAYPEILELYRHHLHYILVDEFQDTNKVQYQLVKLLSEPRRNILVVGDDDQSIYSFRGAKISTIINFDKDFPGTRVVVLDQNYRSSGSILRAANAVISRNVHRKEKNLWTEGEAGEPITLFVGDDETEEADFVAREIAETAATKGLPYSAIAVIYRTNAQSRALEDALVSAGIPYRIFGGLKFYDRKEIKDILAYLRILLNPDDVQAVLRVINTPPAVSARQQSRTLSHSPHRNGQTSSKRAAQSPHRQNRLPAFLNSTITCIAALKRSRSPSLSRRLSRPQGIGHDLRRLEMMNPNRVLKTSSNFRWSPHRWILPVKHRAIPSVYFSTKHRSVQRQMLCKTKRGDRRERSPLRHSTLQKGLSFRLFF